MVNKLIVMFIGRYYHQLEAKGRVSLPKKFREQTEEFVITRGLDGGLFLFGTKEWQTEISKLTSKSYTKKTNRDFVRLMTNDALQVTTDNLGRILIPEYLRQFAKLTKEIVIVGSFNKIEMWDVNEYHAYILNLEKQAETIAEQIEIAL